MVVDGGNETAAKQDLTVKDTRGGGCCCVKEREYNNYNIALELFSLK